MICFYVDPYGYWTNIESIAELPVVGSIVKLPGEARSSKVIAADVITTQAGEKYAMVELRGLR